MFEILTKAFVYALEAYAGLGFVVAVPFVWFGVQRLDSEAQGSGVGFRLQIRRGYGNGLKSYRRLVYAHIAPSKLQTKLHQLFFTIIHLTKGNGLCNMWPWWSLPTALLRLIQILLL